MTASSKSPIQIARLEEHPQHVETVAGWMIKEWGGATVEECVATLVETECQPGALIAIAETQAVGMLGFKSHAHPLKKSGPDELWVNALYVNEPWRGCGVGSQLLRSGVETADQFNCESLFVYTHLPNFYEKRGWQQIGQNSETGMYYLTFSLPGP